MPLPCARNELGRSFKTLVPRSVLKRHECRAPPAVAAGYLMPAFHPCAAISFCFHPVMSRASLAVIVRYCDRLLRTSEIKDYDRGGSGRKPGDGQNGCGGESRLADRPSWPLLGRNTSLDGKTL